MTVSTHTHTLTNTHICRAVLAAREVSGQGEVKWSASMRYVRFDRLCSHSCVLGNAHVAPGLFYVCVCLCIMCACPPVYRACPL